MKMFNVVVLSAMMFFAGLAWAGEVSINKANAETLAVELNGIGAKKAQAIVEYRKSNGPFTDINDLQKVKGISLKTIEKNKKNITL